MPRRPVAHDPLSQDFSGRDLPGRDLAGRDLAGRDLSGRELSERDVHAPRHLAEAWEGPVNFNRPLPSHRHGWHWLLVIPVVMPLLVPLYNRIEPRLLGLPFFYWYQLFCVLIAIVTVTAVYLLTKGRRPRWPR